MLILGPAIMLGGILLLSAIAVWASWHKHGGDDD